MKRLTKEEATDRALQAMGVNQFSDDICSTAAVAATIRRTAAFKCPCSSRSLVQSVAEVLTPLSDDAEAARAAISEVLEAMVVFGDLIELRDTDTAEGLRGSLLYLAPMTFVRRTNCVILLGIPSDDISPLPTEIQERITCSNHLRRIYTDRATDLSTELEHLGLIQLKEKAWLKDPISETSDAHLKRLNTALDNASDSTDIPGLTLLNPATDPMYWKGRWEAPASHSGRFVCRRPQRYGSDLWCYVQIQDGMPRRLLDLPLYGSKWRGCDEAWQLQSAIDAVDGRPQRYSLTYEQEKVCIDFFSPIPGWARRKWDAIGEQLPVVRPANMLLSYRFMLEDLIDELDYTRDRLWLTER